MFVAEKRPGAGGANVETEKTGRHRNPSQARMVLAAIIPGYAVPSRVERERLFYRVDNHFRENSPYHGSAGGRYCPPAETRQDIP
jgi:hypothetical protein